MVPNLQLPDARNPGADHPHPDAELIELERTLKFTLEAARQPSAAYEEAGAAVDSEMPEYLRDYMALGKMADGRDLRLADTMIVPFGRLAERGAA